MDHLFHSLLSGCLGYFLRELYIDLLELLPSIIVIIRSTKIYHHVRRLNQLSDQRGVSQVTVWVDVNRAYISGHSDKLEIFVKIRRAPNGINQVRSNRPKFISNYQPNVRTGPENSRSYSRLLIP